jgi:hypothetical protein
MPELEFRSGIETPTAEPPAYIVEASMHPLMNSLCWLYCRCAVLECCVIVGLVISYNLKSFPDIREVTFVIECNHE